MRHSFWILLEILKHLLLLPRELLHPLHQALVQFFLAHFDGIIAAHFGQYQACAHAANGDVAIFGAQIIFAVIEVFDFLLLSGQLLLELTPNLFKFHLHHAWRQIEIMFLGQLVEQVFFQMAARHLAVIGANLLTHGFFQLFEAFHAQRAGEFFGDFSVFGFAHFMHGAFENGGFASQIGGAIIGWEIDGDIDFIAGFGADQLLFEAGNKLARAQLKVEPFASAAIKSFAIDAAEEVDFHAIAVLGFGGFGARHKIFAA